MLVQLLFSVLLGFKISLCSRKAKLPLNDRVSCTIYLRENVHDNNTQ